MLFWLKTNISFPFLTGFFCFYDLTKLQYPHEYTVLGILGSILGGFLAGTPVEKFEPPEGIISKRLCESSGSAEYFIAGTEPKGNCLIISPEPVKKSATPSATPSQ